MKKITVVFMALILGSALSFADSITLTSPEPLAVPLAAKISEWEITKINADEETMAVKYRWLDNTGKRININLSGWHDWTCRNLRNDTNPVRVEDCTDIGVPDACCTGVAEGSCDDQVLVDTCFDDVFGFEIRSQDVGTGIGLGLRTLIWNQMKQDILDSNDGSFD
jgi:hypothetical protein